MINIKRSYPSPESLKKEKEKELKGIKESGSYRNDDVVKRLMKDFKGKCYLCESFATSSQIEHLKSHRGDIELKFDWNNLFLCCTHCNNIKNKFYDNILDCTKEDVESRIRYKMDIFPGSDVYLYPLENDIRTKETVELLEKCYNGTTQLKKIDSSNIKKDILNELKAFLGLINNYFEIIEEDEYDNEELLIVKSKIKRTLGVNSKYTSFKRWIIKDNEMLLIEFGKYFAKSDKECIK